MLMLVLGLILFLGIHLLPTAPDLRRGLADRLGETGYKVAFSLVSLVGLALIVIGYGKLQTLAGKNPELWSPPIWAKHISFALMLPALILLASAYVPSRIRTAVRHPMLAAIKIWAFAHLLANGDVASLVLFGSFLAFAVYDRISVKRRAAAGMIAAPRAGGARGDLIAVVIGAVLYAWLMLGGHARLIGAALLPGIAP